MFPSENFFLGLGQNLNIWLCLMNSMNGGGKTTQN